MKKSTSLAIGLAVFAATLALEGFVSNRTAVQAAAVHIEVEDI